MDKMLLKKIPLPSCIFCRDCRNRISPFPIVILSSKDMDKLNYSGCLINNKNYLVCADRKCKNYEYNS